MIKDKPLTIRKILPAILFRNISNLINKSQKKDFPKIIGDYSFLRKFKPEGLNSNRYQYALYQDRSGNKAFAKMWVGYFKNLGYLSLVNEINILEILAKTIKDNAGKIPAEFRQIAIPKLLEKQVEENAIITLTEYIDKTVPLTKLEDKVAFKYFIRVHNYLKWLGNKIAKDQRKLISVRPISTVYLLAPLFFAKTLIIYPKLATKILKGVFLLLTKFNYFFKYNKLVFGHRDLHFENILYSKTNRLIYILDFQYCLYSNEIYDLLFTTRLHWNNEFIRKDLLDFIFRISENNKNRRWFTRSLMIVAALHGLSGGSSVSQDMKENNLKFLDYAIDDGFQFPNNQLLVSRLRDVLFFGKSRFRLTNNVSFPERIGKFMFLKEPKVNKEVNFYRFALYEDGGGKKAFAKAWFGERKNTAYYWLRNEIALFTAFTLAYESKSIEYQASHFRVPRVYEVYEKDGCLIILSENISGAKENFSDKELTSLYNGAIAYLQDSGEKIKSSLKGRILSIGPAKILLSFPFIFVKSLVSKPKLWREIIAGGYLFVRHGLSLYGLSWDTLVHRDLRGTILQSDKHYYIIDWQTVAITNSMLELTQLFLTYWENSKLVFDVFKLGDAKEIFALEKKLNCFKALCIYVALVEIGFIGIKNQLDEKTFLQQVVNWRIKK